jgi:hypothetical protein
MNPLDIPRTEAVRVRKGFFFSIARQVVRFKSLLVVVGMGLTSSAQAAWTYTGGVLNAAQTYDGLGADSALNPRSQGTATDGDYIGSGNGGTGSITVTSGSLTIGASDFKVANGAGSNGTLNVNGGTLNINQIGQWGGGVGMTGTGVLNIASGAVVNWQTSGSSEQRFMIGNGSSGGVPGNGTLNLNGGTLNNTLDTAQALTDGERQWRVGSDGGRGTVNLNAGTWNVTGAIPFFLGGKYTNQNGAPTLNQSATVSVINITNGSLVQTGIATAAGFSTTASTFTIGANDYVNFIVGGTGSLSLQGWTQADFEALVDAGKIRVDGAAVAGQYEHFVYSSVSGQGVYKLSGALFAPSFSTAPSAVNGFVGQSGSLSAVVTGNPPPTAQWQKSTDNGATWTNISGATSSMLSFASLVYADNALYRLVAANSGGSVTSDGVALTVTYPNPTLVSSPLSQTVLVGGNATLTVAATGLGSLTYKWQKDGMDLVPAQTGASLSLSNMAASAAGVYTVIVTDHAAEADALPATTTSATAVVTVLEAALPQHAISLNFVGAATVNNTFGGASDLGILASAESAGILPVSNWNNSATTNGVGTQAAPIALVDNLGASTTVSATWSSTNTWAVNPAQGTAASKTADHRLFHGYIERRTSASPGYSSVSFTQIPYGTYDVYVYLIGGTAGAVGKVTANGNDAGAIYYKTYGTVTAATVYTQSTAVSLSAAQALTYNSNFVRFTGLSGASLALAVADAINNTNSGGLAAISIVDTTPANMAYPASVTVPPASLFKLAGASASFSVTASSINSGGVLTYQWSKEGQALSGATSSTLNLTNVSTASSGSYSVTITDSPAGKTPSNVTYVASLVVVGGDRPALLNVDIGTASSPVMVGDGILRTTGIPQSGANQNLGQSGGSAATWNGLAGAAGASTYTVLKESTGLTLGGVTFNVTGAGGVEDNTTQGTLGSTTDGAGPLMRDLLYTDNQSTPLACTVGGLGDFAGKKVTLVVYAVGKLSTFFEEALTNDAATVTLSNNNNYLGTAALVTSNANGRNLDSNTQAYVAFQGIVSSSGTVAWTLSPDADAGRIPLNGFQLLITNEDVNIAPTVTTHPVSSTLLEGLPYSFDAGVIASPAAALQWQKSAIGGSTWTNIPGATSSSYAISSVAAADTGSYRLVATNSAGSVTSNVATLTVQSYPLSASRGISVNWSQTGTAVILPSTEVAGVVGLANWDNRVPSATTFTNLIDSTGAITSASVQLSAGGAWRSFTAAASLPMQRLFASYWDITPGSPPAGTTATMTVNGLTYASYDVYVYLATDGPNNARTAKLAVNGGTEVFAKVMGSNSTTVFPTYMAEGSATSAATATLSNYVKFTGLTGASFTLVGTKVDGNYGIVGFQIVNTASSLSPRETWRQSHFGTTANSGQAADTADPDGDGLANLLEYAFGEDPTVANEGPAVVVATASGVLTLTFVHIDDPSLSYVVEASGDLTGVWTTAQTYTGFTVAGTTTFTDSVSLTAGSRRFLRVKVVVP